MRLFIAIELSEDVRAQLARVQNVLKLVLPKASYTKPENLHVTLKFLGETDAKKQGQLVESLAMIRTEAVRLEPEKVDCFPNRGPVRIVTSALGGSVKPLRALHEAIEQRCKFLGYEREQRAFRPHVTLARARPVLPARFRHEAEEATRTLYPGPAFEPGEFVLMES